MKLYCDAYVRGPKPRTMFFLFEVTKAPKATKLKKGDKFTCNGKRYRALTVKEVVFKHKDRPSSKEIQVLGKAL